MKHLLLILFQINLHCNGNHSWKKILEKFSRFWEFFNTFFLIKTTNLITSFNFLYNGTITIARSTEEKCVWYSLWCEHYYFLLSSTIVCPWWHFGENCMRISIFDLGFCNHIWLVILTGFRENSSFVLCMYILSGLGKLKESSQTHKELEENNLG